MKQNHYVRRVHEKDGRITFRVIGRTEHKQVYKTEQAARNAAKAYNEK